MSTAPQALPDQDLDFRPVGGPTRKDEDLDFRPVGPKPKPAAAPQPQPAPSQLVQPSGASLLPEHALEKATGISALPKPGLLERARQTVLGGVESGETALGRAIGRQYATAQSSEYNEPQPFLRTEALAPEHGLVRGGLKFASELTRPESALLLAGSGGLGELGAIGRGVIGRLMSTGFGFQMLRDAYARLPEFREALHSGDAARAREVLTQGTLEAAAGAFAGRHALRGFPSPAVEQPRAGELGRPLLQGAEPAETRTLASSPAKPEAQPTLAPQEQGPPRLGAVTQPTVARADLERAGRLRPRQVATSAESAVAKSLGFEPLQTAEAPPAVALEETAAVRVGPPLERAEATGYQRQRAQSYVNLVRNPLKRGYAQDYLRARLEGGAEPDRGPLSAMAAQAVRSNIEERLGREKPAAPGEKYAPEVLDEAAQELRSANHLWQSLPAAGRFEAVAGEPFTTEEKGAGWYGIPSSKGSVAEMHPWLADLDTTPGKLRDAIQRGKGAEYNRLLDRVAGYVQAQREEAAPVIQEYSPRLRELAGQIQGTEPELAGTLTDLADGKLSGIRNLREYVERRITDATEAAGLKQALAELDRAEAGERLPEGAEERAQFVGGAREPEGVLPGLAPAVEEQRVAAAARQGERLTEEVNRPPESIEQAAGEMERLSPLFRGTEASQQREMFSQRGFVTPELLRDVLSGRALAEPYRERFAGPLIERAGLGDKYAAVAKADPGVAAGLHLLDNAPRYLRAKAAQHVHDIIGGLTRGQERLFTLLADADSRENLQKNHPEEYDRAAQDPAIQAALQRYRPIERELTEARKKLGGAVLDQDYLRRIYEQHVAGIGQEQAPGERPAVPFDRMIRPQRAGGLSREASAEYHYQQGLHEFGPTFGAKFIGTHLAALRDQVARDFMEKATPLKRSTEGSTQREMFGGGGVEPREITYNGQRYYRPDIAAEMRRAGARGVKEFDRYDPQAGQRTLIVQKPTGDVSAARKGPIYLGPREIVRTLQNYGGAEEGKPSGLQRFFQEQIVGFGFGMPHVANILRRVSQSAPGGALNPTGWARAWRVAFDSELRARGVAGLNDPTFDRLAQHGAISPGEMRNLKAYWGGNLNPANWARSLAAIGHRLLFEPGTFRGFGGFDQRARVYVADLIRSQNPSLADAEIARAVSTQLGDYNRANWTDQQKQLARFMLFPGWDFSSMRWVIQHPIRTSVPSALLVLTANQVLHQLGLNREEDTTDISNVHLGDRSYGLALLREPLARNLLRPAINYAQGRLAGQSSERAAGTMGRGLESGAAGVVGMLRPDISLGIDLAANRQSLFSRRELIQPGDDLKPGKLLPTAALDKVAAVTVRHALPWLDRLMDTNQKLDLRSFVGGNMGLPNYRQDAESRLLRNAAEAERTYSELSSLAKTNPQRARQFLAGDPGSASLAVFRRDLSGMVSTLHKIDAAREQIEQSGLPDREKQSRLNALDQSRRQLLENADGLDHLVFERAHQRRIAPARPMLELPSTGQAARVGAQP